MQMSNADCAPRSNTGCTPYQLEALENMCKMSCKENPLEYLIRAEANERKKENAQDLDAPSPQNNKNKQQDIANKYLEANENQKISGNEKTKANDQEKEEQNLQADTQHEQKHADVSEDASMMSPIDKLNAKKLQAFDQTALEEALERVYNPKISREEHMFLLQQFAKWADDLNNPALAFPIIEGTTYSGMTHTYNFKGVDAPVTTDENYASLIKDVTRPKRSHITKNAADNMNDEVYADYQYLKDNGIVCNEAAKMLHDIAYANDGGKSTFSSGNGYIKKENQNKLFKLESDGETPENASIPVLGENLENAIQGDALYYWDLTDIRKDVIDACDNDPQSKELTTYLLTGKLSPELQQKIIVRRIGKAIGASDLDYDTLIQDKAQVDNALNNISQQTIKFKNNSEIMAVLEKAYELEKKYNSTNASKKAKQKAQKEYETYKETPEFQNVKEEYELYKKELSLISEQAECSRKIDLIHRRDEAVQQYKTAGIVPQGVSTEIPKEKKTTPAHIETVFATRGSGQAKEIATVGAHGSNSPNGISLTNKTKGKVKWESISDLTKGRIVRLYQKNDPNRTIVDFGSKFMDASKTYTSEMALREVELKKALKNPTIDIYSALMPDQDQNRSSIDNSEVTSEHKSAANATWEISSNKHLQSAIVDALTVKFDWSNYTWECFNPQHEIDTQEKKLIDLKKHFTNLYTEKYTHNTAFVDEIAKSVYRLLQDKNGSPRKDAQKTFDNENIKKINYSFEQQENMKNRSKAQAAQKSLNSNQEKLQKALDNFSKTRVQEKKFSDEKIKPLMNDISTNHSEIEWEKLQNGNFKRGDKKNKQSSPKLETAFSKLRTQYNACNKKKYLEIQDAIDQSIEAANFDQYDQFLEDFLEKTAEQLKAQMDQNAADREAQEKILENTPGLVVQRYLHDWSLTK